MANLSSSGAYKAFCDREGPKALFFVSRGDAPSEQLLQLLPALQQVGRGEWVCCFPEICIFFVSYLCGYINLQSRFLILLLQLSLTVTRIALALPSLCSLLLIYGCAPSCCFWCLRAGLCCYSFGIYRHLLRFCLSPRECKCHTAPHS